MSPNVNQNNTLCQPDVSLCQPNKIYCENCNKVFNTRQSKSKHKKKCKIKEISPNEINELKENNKILENTINELKAQVAMILKDTSTEMPINCQLIDIISNKNKKNRRIT